MEQVEHMRVPDAHFEEQKRVISGVKGRVISGVKGRVVSGVKGVWFQASNFELSY